MCAEKSTMAASTPPIPFKVLGSIREERCSHHAIVEWEVGSEIGEGRTLDVASPSFDIGTHLLFLNLRLQPGQYPSLCLFGLGKPLPRPVQCWFGFRFQDGTIFFGDIRGDLSPRGEIGLWARVSNYDVNFLFDLKKLYEGRLTIFFRINVEPTGEDTCTHNKTPNLSMSFGSIREERCASHTQVQWDLDYGKPDVEYFSLDSPIFKIGSQHYVLKLRRTAEGFYGLTLFRSGRSVPVSFRYWAGTRHGGETHPLWVSNGELDLLEDLCWWASATNLIHFSSPDWEQHLTSDGRLTFLFRLNMESREEGKCTHDLAVEDALECEGSIRKEDCSSHTYLEWEIAFRSSRETGIFSASPVFEVGSQKYQITLCCASDALVGLRLYRLGPTADEDPSRSIRCWVGLKNRDGAYHHHMQVTELDLSEEFSLWVETAFFRFPSLSELERSHVTSDRCLRIFLRMDGTRSTGDEVTCTHGAADMCPRGEGVIWNGHRVEWEVAYEAPRDHAHLSTSPIFRIGDQWYLLELLYDLDGILTLSLYRSGRAIKGRDLPVRYWAGCQEGWKISYCKKDAELDLGEDNDLWTKAAVLGYYRRLYLNKVPPDHPLVFFFRVESSAPKRTTMVLSSVSAVVAKSASKECLQTTSDSSARGSSDGS